MANVKTSAETAASALDGTELVRVVQGGNNRRTTAQAIADRFSQGAVTLTDLNASSGVLGQVCGGTGGQGGQTVTVSTPVINLTQTWNDSGVTFTGGKINITDTASAAASILFAWQVGGSSRVYITKQGKVFIPGDGAGGQYLVVDERVFCGGVDVANGRQIIFSDGSDFARGLAAVSGAPGVRITNGSTGHGFLQLSEITAPSAPAANTVVLYAVDNGGKTELMARFPSGASQRVAIEP